jgi:uncharacterized protein with PQ loop repeat
VLQAIGYVGSAGAALMWVPQAFRAIRNRRDADALAGISLVAYLGAVVFNALLLSYGVVSRATPVVVAGSANLLCAAVIVAVLVRSRSVVS